MESSDGFRRRSPAERSVCGSGPRAHFRPRFAAVKLVGPRRGREPSLKGSFASRVRGPSEGGPRTVDRNPPGRGRRVGPVGAPVPAPAPVHRHGFTGAGSIGAASTRTARPGPARRARRGEPGTQQAAAWWCPGEQAPPVGGSRRRGPLVLSGAGHLALSGASRHPVRRQKRRLRARPSRDAMTGWPDVPRPPNTSTPASSPSGATGSATRPS